MIISSSLKVGPLLNASAMSGIYVISHCLCLRILQATPCGGGYKGIKSDFVPNICLPCKISQCMMLFHSKAIIIFKIADQV